jgi:molybdate/tungstate transport system ATP-binding protein
MISVERLTAYAGKFSLIDLSFKVERSAYAVLMGRTGTGKTTLLESICGLKRIANGIIRIGDRDVTQLKPAERGVAYVPQDRALFGTMSVKENLAFALIVRKWSRAAIDRRVGELAELLGITHLLERRPHGLSGGEAQRVALGRALASRPSILLLDEPLSALDDQTREEMYTLLRSVRERTNVTTLHVTHNLSEAAQLADQILLLEAGEIRPREVIKPKSMGVSL